MQNLLQGLNIYLVGMMGSGKTTVGELLAKQLGYKFFDTDALITQVAGKSISNIFAEEGEVEFRAIEAQVLGEISSYTRLVVATGGGIVMNQQNWGYLHQGLVIWLDVPIPLLIARLQCDRQTADQRPLLQSPNPEQRLQEILMQRQEMYAEADLRISISSEHTPPMVQTEIWEVIPTVIKKSTRLDRQLVRELN